MQLLEGSGSILLFARLVIALLPGCSDVEQGPECRAFVACVKEADTVRGTVTNVDRFLPSGACWGGEKGAAVCESACRRGVPVLRAQEPRVACASGEGAR
ncbi:MAG: hypothetical protein IPG50_34525 [Myxococcales bacterium]|nr:hypothetical protein [Myxococcales bacterium]